MKRKRKKLKKKFRIIILFLFVLISFLFGFFKTKKDTYFYVDIGNRNEIVNLNGVNIYYTVEGKGKPVILLHGNGSTHESMSAIKTKLVNSGYRVYSIDSRGHGKSDKFESYHYTDMAKDVYNFIIKFNITKPSIIGFSDGGIIGLIVSIENPKLLSNLVTSGANLTPDGLTFDTLVRFNNNYKNNHNALTKMMIDEPNIDDSELTKIKIPVLVTAAEDDIVMESHTKLIANNIKKSKLIIYNGEEHGSYKSKDKYINDILDFYKNNSF